jgi:hypothetical protein
LTELVVLGSGDSDDLVSLSEGKGGTEVQKMERERALLAGVQLLQLVGDIWSRPLSCSLYYGL